MKKNPKSSFWLLLAILNLGLFLPSTILGNPNFLEGFLARDTFYRHITFFFNRASDDSFRISLDLLILLWVAYSLGGARKSISALLISGSYIVLFSYALYASVFRHLYFFKPIFANDITLLKYGTLILFEESGWAFLGIVILTILFFWLCYKGTTRLVTLFLDINIYRSKSFLIISTIAFISAFRYYLIPLFNNEPFKFTNEPAIQLISNSIAENIVSSSAMYETLQKFNLDSIAESRRDLFNFDLREKPNIYILFIESYGEVAYELPEVKKRYLSALDLFESDLSKNGLHMASSFSKSPVNGGASWLSYSSFINGLKIDNQGLYQRLVHNEKFQNVPNLFKWLQTQTYEVFYLAPMKRTSYSPDLDTYTKFYGVDHWVSATDFTHYSGQRYGWNAPPPDEYTLNFSYDKYLKEQTKPFVFFYLTKNSHTPFLSPKKSSINWHELDKDTEKPTPSTSFFAKPTVSDYTQAIEYQLDYLSKFILRNTSENDIVMLVGDHQPPIITPASSSYNTMAHVISRDAAFIELWNQNGFEKGMRINQPTGTTHESLLWILTTAMENSYGIVEEK